MVLSGVGATLREERLRRQFTIEHVSNVTRISAKYLEAIENDRPEHLPGTVFTRGFVQQYARFLDLPSEDLLSQLPKVDIENAALPVPPPKPRRPLWNPRWTLPAMGLSIASALLLAGGGAWFYFDLTPVVVAAAKAAVSAARDQQAAKNQQTVAAARQAPPIVQRSEAGIPEEPVVTEQKPEPDRAISDSTAAEANLPQGGAVQVMLRANADAWVQVMADGKKAFTGMLHRNDSREISGHQLVRVMTGNAGGLEISLNGRVLEPIGPAGQVRTVRLTAEGLLPDLKTPGPVSDPL